MKALTVLQPWATAIASGKKQVENRGWAPPKWLVGKDLVIHAGKAPMEEDEAVDVFKLITGVPSVNDVWDDFAAWVNATTMGAVVAVVTVRGVMSAAQARELGQSDWHMGDDDNIGWWLENLRLPAKPIACRGAQGLWDLPADVEKTLRESLYAAPVVRR